MKKLSIFILAVLMLTACGNSEKQLRKKAAETNEVEQTNVDSIENIRKEQALFDVLNDYLVKEIGSQYLQGDLCVPALMIVDAEEINDSSAYLWGDFWVFNYNIDGDTLKTVSGGNHSGCMTLQMQDGQLVVTHFEQTEDGANYDPSAKRIFGEHYDAFQSLHSDEDVREDIRVEQLQEYIKHHNLNVHYYQDYGWPAVAL